MRAREVIATVFSNPLEVIEAIAAFALTISGLWLLSPFYNAAVSSLSQAGTYYFVIGLGVFQVALGLFALWALFNLRWPGRVKARRFFTGTAFGLYSFYFIAQLFLFGLASIPWVGTLTLALIIGTCHLASGRGG